MNALDNCPRSRAFSKLSRAVIDWNRSPLYRARELAEMSHLFFFLARTQGYPSAHQTMADLAVYYRDRTDRPWIWRMICNAALRAHRNVGRPNE